MGYQALLFCPDEKTARVVTDVLSELEFSAEACTEPFAAVKKLMGEHFDAIVVDCDNEQNATLLFKSARNSTSNQASLAVAVVEGQAGVAKAFRIGANLVLTKPINVEQAKGTLRVARGLLRKGDPAKGVQASAAASSSTTPTAPARTAPQTFASENLAPRLGAPNPPARPFPTPAAPPTVAAQMAAASSGVSDDDDVIDVNEPTAPASPKTAVASSGLKPPSRPDWTSVPASSPAAIPPTSTVSTSFAGAGGGSAAAPARSAQRVPVENAAPLSASALFEKSPDSGKAESSVAMPPPPSFSFGGANEIEKPAGSKKVLIGLAAAALVAAGLYVGLTQFHGKPSAPKEVPTLSEAAPKDTAPPKVPVATAPSKPAPDATVSSSAPTQPTAQPSVESLMDAPVTASNPRTPDKTAAAKGTAKSSASTSVPPAKPSSDAEPAPQPIVVKSGTTITPVHQSSAAPDAAAPSALDIAPSASGGSLSNLLVNPGDTSKPVLQTLNVSQGVSQGLLIKKVQPTYPPVALRLHVEGAVQLLATIGKSGNITAVKIVSGEPVLAQSALDAVKQWKYKPYYLNGDPVEIQTQVTINFKLPK